METLDLLTTRRAEAEQVDEDLNFLNNLGMTGEEPDEALPMPKMENKIAAPEIKMHSAGPTTDPEIVAADPGVMKTVAPEEPEQAPADPLLSQGGDWRGEILNITADGKPATVNAGKAVDHLNTRIASMKQLLDCINAV